MRLLKMLGLGKNKESVEVLPNKHDSYSRIMETIETCVNEEQVNMMYELAERFYRIYSDKGLYRELYGRIVSTYRDLYKEDVQLTRTCINLDNVLRDFG